MGSVYYTSKTAHREGLKFLKYHNVTGCHKTSQTDERDRENFPEILERLNGKECQNLIALACYSSRKILYAIQGTVLCFLIRSKMTECLVI